MNKDQLKDSGLLLIGNIIIKLSNFFKQLILAFFLGISEAIDIYLLAMIIPTIIQGMLGGGIGEIIVTKLNSKEEKKGFIETYVSLFTLVTVICIIVYITTINLWTPFFVEETFNQQLFINLSLLFSINLIPAYFASVLKPLLYYKGHYKYYILTTFIAELASITLIYYLVSDIGIYAFVYGIIMNMCLQAIFYYKKTSLNFKIVIRSRIWKKNKLKLIKAAKQTLTLGLQTLVFHLSTLSQRFLAVKYLAPGYLSSFNYAKNLSVLPSSILLSSVITTTYIEQVRKKNNSLDEFNLYTNRMGVLFSKLSLFLQTVLMIFSPLIIVLFYRRGAFDENAVELTLIIFQILIIGFFSKIIFDFLSRTFYILSFYKSLFVGILLKTICEISILYFCINTIDNVLPIAFVISNFFILFYMLMLLYKNNNETINLKTFVFTSILSSVTSIMIIYFYSFIIHYLLNISLFKLASIYIIPFLLTLTIVYYYLNKIPELKLILNLIKSKFNGK